jgi:hypothetical protein
MASSHRDYVPQNAAQFNVFVRNIIQYVEAKTAGAEPQPSAKREGSPLDAAWTNIPQDRTAILKDSHLLFEQAFNTALETPTRANTLRRQEAQTATASILREFVNQFLRFPPVTNPDRAEMGIPNHDTIRTDHKVVTEIVDFVIHLSSIRELVIDFWIQGASHKAKPHGYDGAVIIWGLRDTPPETPDQLEHHTMASRTPFTLHFEETERGRTVYAGLAWQNERGIMGAWSEYKSAVVP